MENIKLNEISAYLPYGVKCQYEGIVNGKELGAYDAKMRSSLDAEKFYYENPRPLEIKGLKVGKIKRISLFNNYWVAHIGIMQKGLKSFYSGTEFKLLLRHMSSITTDELKDFYSLTSTEMELIDIEEWKQDLVHLINSGERFQHLQFQKLHEWHFDLYSLIDRGLAIAMP